MKKILSWILIFTLCLGLFAGCGSNEDENPTTQPTISETQPPVVSTEDLQSAMEYIRTIYRGAPEKTPQDFQRIGNVPINGVDYEVVWTVNVDEDVIKIVKETNGMVTIDVNELCENDTPYELTATITDGNGNTVTHTWKHLLPAAMDMGEILDEAYALENGESLPYDATLTGKVISIDTAWNPDYQNITVTIAVEGHEDKPVQCYRLKGEGADKLAVGNIITVTGKLKNYNGTIEFDAGCILDKVEKGDAIEAPTDMIQIVKDAYKLADGKSLPYNAVLKGKVTKINTPYDPAYKNISVTIAVAGIEDKPILCYRLKGTEASQIAVNDTITVSGLIKNYKGTIEFDAGCQLIERISGGGVAQAPSSDANKILSDAAKLAEGESLAYKATLTGEVVSVDTPYSDQYGNVTVTMKVNGVKIQCYRMKGDHAADVRATDKITVSGFIKNYFGKLEFDTGCTLDAWTMGSRVVAVNYGPLKENTPYNLAMAQNAIGKNLYFGGQASGNYLSTSENAADAVEVFMEKVEGKGVRFYFLDGETKTYINIIPRDTDASKTYPNLSTTASGYFVYDEEAKTYAVENAGSRFYLGTYGTYNTISTSSTYYITGGNAANVGVSQFVAQFIAAGTELPEQGEQPEQPGDEDEDGTVLTIPEANEKGKAQASGAYTSVKYKVTGKITEIYNTQYGNMYIADEAGNTLLIYGTYSADGSTRFDAMEVKPAVGDTVTIYGAVGNFNGNAQIKNGWIVAINGEGGEGGETPDTPADPTTPVAPEVGTAYNFGMIQEAVSTTDIYYIKGGMSGYYMATSNNVADALEVYLEPATNGYYLYYMDGNTKTYINMVVSSDGAHVNGEYSATKSTVYTYDAEMQTLVTDINDGTYRFGTRNDKTYTTVGPVDVTKGNFYCKFYPVAGTDEPDEPDTPDTPVVPPVDPEEPTEDYVTEVTAGTAYKWGINQEGLGKVIYFAGEMDGYYGKTTENFDEAVDVILEATTGGYYVSFVNASGAKKYVNVVVSGNYKNFTIADSASTVYTFDEEYDTLNTVLSDGGTYYIGTYGTYKTFSVSAISKISTSYPSHFYLAGGEGGETPDEPVVPPVDPTVPVTPEVGTAYNFGMIQEAVSTTDIYYIKGGMSGYYMATSNNVADALEVYLEPATNGYYLYYMDGNTKTYINMVVSSDGAHVNGEYSATKSTVYTYDAEMQTLVADINDGTYRFGTRNDKTYTTVGPVDVTKGNFYCKFYPVAGTDEPDTPDTPDTPVVPPVDPEEPTEDYVTEVTAGTAYKWGINQEGLGKVIYFAGEMDGYYGKTTENFDEGVDVILEATTGGYYVSFVNASGAKKYVNVVVSGNYKNFTIADSASTVYTFDEEYDTLNTVLSDGGTYYIGTYGTYKTFSVSAISKISTSYPSHFYLEGSEGGETPDEPDTPDTPVTPPTGTGYVKITEASQLVSGKYVLVAGNGHAPTALNDASANSPWLLNGQPTIGDGVITEADAEGFVFTLTVDGASVKLVDANGNPLSPKAGNTNGIISADYNWAWTFENGKFKFAGTGNDTTVLACNTNTQNGLNRFRAYKTTTVAGSSEYLPNFELYLYVEEEKPTAEGYVQVTEASQLTSGKYVLVAGNGQAPTALNDASANSPWLLNAQPTVTEGVITEANAEGFVFTLTVDGASVKLVDANGNALSPKAGNTNGIISADYNWAWTFENGTFKFAGTGNDTTVLACNTNTQNGLNRFRAYKTTTVAGSSEYLPNFTLYKLAG